MLFAFLPLWPTLGVFGAAISIPVIIHLINSKRFKIVPWAAMKFLLAAQKQTRKRMRIEQLLLLLCRMMILAMVIFAMAAVMEWAEGVWAAEPMKSVLSFCNIGGLGPAKRLATHRTHHILVLDASLSMNQKSIGDQTAFEVAKQMALRKITDYSSGDGFSVLVLKDRPEWVVREASQDARKVSRVIESLKPTHGNASLPGALSMVASKLAEGRARFPRQAVYFFTDMQRATWMGAAAESDGKEKLPYQEITEKATATIFVDCSPLKVNNNLAVTNLEFDLTRNLYVTTGNEYTLKATVRNYGTEPKQVRAEVLRGRAKETAGDSPLEMRVTGDHATETVGPNGAERVFKIDKIKFDKPGTYAVQVRLPDDALLADNSRTIIITVRDTIPVLLVNGKSSPDPVERASEFLRLSLNPFRVGDEPKFLPLRPIVVTPGQFSNMTDAELEPYDCIYFCDLPKIDPNVLPRVDAHLRRGGGLMVTLGPNSAGNLGDYNDVLYKDGHGLLPAELKKTVAAPAEHSYFLQATDDDVYKYPPLAAFAADRDRLTLRTARFTQFVQAVVPEGKGRTLLHFLLEYTVNDKVPRDKTLPEDGPAIIEWSPPLNRAHQPATEVVKGPRVARSPLRYRGKVVLVTTAINTEWSNWPGSPSFVPMMHELTRLAVSGRLREQTQTVGAVLDGFLPGGAEVGLDVKFPPEYLKLLDDKTVTKTRTKLIDGVNFFRFDETATNFAGVYRVHANIEREKKDKKNDTETIEGYEIPFAINVPATTGVADYSESDLVCTDADQLKVTYPDWKFQIVRDPVQGNIEGGTINPDAENVPLPVGPDLANIALLIVLALLFLEVLLAWHFGHYTTTEGAVAQTTPSATVTGIAAGLAIVAAMVVALGAAVIFHERQTNDLFGFLPDIVRSYIEQFMGIEPPQAGEARNWNLESASFLFGLPGGETSYGILISLAALAMIYFTYKAEAPRVSLGFKLLLGTMRFCLILTCVWFLLPRLQIQYARQGWPDLVLLIDDSGSMGTSDTFNDREVIKRVQELSKSIRERLDTELPDRLKAIQDDLAVKKPIALKDPEGRPDLMAEVDALERRLAHWNKQQEDLRSGSWRPSRLQLVQAILSQKEPHWLKTLLTQKQTKIHVFHLDSNGDAIKLRDLKGDAGEIVGSADLAYLDRTEKAIKDLDPVGKESRLGKSVRHVIDHYRGSSLSAVIMFTDGVTTRDETLSEAGAYAKSNNVSLFFVGIGDEKDVRSLKLTDLHVEDTIYKGDTAVFDVQIQGSGFKDLTVPIILKIIDEKTKKETEVARVLGKVDPNGKPKKVPALKHTPDKVGRIRYVVEIEQPKLEANEKPQPRSNLRLEKTVEVVDLKTIRVLYVEDQPRYEFRYIKFLLEREFDDKAKKQPLDKNKPKAIELKVLLLDADGDFHNTDEHAIRHFPPTIDELLRYDVLIIGDCNPSHPKLKGRLKDIKAYAQGVTEDGKKLPKAGGGVLFIAGAFNNPHRYKGTPLEDILPIEPIQGVPPPEVPRTERYRPELTPLGRNHPIFKFGADDAQSGQIWGNLSQIYWYSSKYKARPTARVYATHPEKGEDGKKIPLVVESLVGASRSMFFGFDETWRWRKAGEEKNFNRFWVETMRFLAHGRSMHTKLVLEKQTPYTVGEKITVKVTFPESTPGGAQQGPKIDDKTEVKVKYEYVPLDATGKLDPEVKDMANLTKVANNTYEGTLPSALVREGKYRFRLWQPDVSSTQPDHEKPSAEALVNPLPGELDNLRMDLYEMREAANRSSGEVYTIATADKLLIDIPRGDGIITNTNMPPTLLWNQLWVLVLIVLLITSEWVLRKVKHLL